MLFPQNHFFCVGVTPSDGVTWGSPPPPSWCHCLRGLLFSRVVQLAPCGSNLACEGLTIWSTETVPQCWRNVEEILQSIIVVYVSKLVCGKMHQALTICNSIFIINSICIIYKKFALLFRHKLNHYHPYFLCLWPLAECNWIALLYRDWSSHLLMVDRCSSLPP